MKPKRRVQKTPKGQWIITLPKHWESILKLRPGTTFEWDYQDPKTLILRRV
jgi:phosphate uptake regulator